MAPDEYPTEPREPSARVGDLFLGVFERLRDRLWGPLPVTAVQCGMIADQTLRQYEALVATHPALERKGKTMPYTSVNGHMFSFLAPDGTLALRLPDADRAAFLERYETRLVEQHGHVMKEYVAVPAALLGRLNELEPYFDLSWSYVSSLPPKKTGR